MPVPTAQPNFIINFLEKWDEFDEKIDGEIEAILASFEPDEISFEEEEILKELLD